MKLNQLSTLLKRAKNSRAILNYCNVTPKGIYATDLETTILIKNKYNLDQGIHLIEKLGEFSRPDNTGLINEYPSLNPEYAINDKQTITVDSLAILVKHASNDETRLHINTVYFTESRAVATNGFHLRYFDLNESLKESYIVAKESIELLLKLCKSFKVSSVVIKFSSDWTIADNEFFRWESRTIQREYLKYQAVIPKKLEHTFNVTNWIDLKELKPHLNKRSYACKIKGIENNVFLSIPETDIKIVIGDCDSDFEIGFNLLFLDIAREGKKTFKVGFNNNLSPCLVNESVVMPLKL